MDASVAFSSYGNKYDDDDDYTNGTGNDVNEKKMICWEAIFICRTLYALVFAKVFILRI